MRFSRNRYFAKTIKWRKSSLAAYSVTDPDYMTCIAFFIEHCFRENCKKCTLFRRMPSIFENSFLYNFGTYILDRLPQRNIFSLLAISFPQTIPHILNLLENGSIPFQVFACLKKYHANIVGSTLSKFMGVVLVAKPIRKYLHENSLNVSHKVEIVSILCSKPRALHS